MLVSISPQVCCLCRIKQLLSIKSPNRLHFGLFTMVKINQPFAGPQAEYYFISSCKNNTVLGATEICKLTSFKLHTSCFFLLPFSNLYPTPMQTQVTSLESIYKILSCSLEQYTVLLTLYSYLE